ncbi:unnamed protein product [Brachionus calyciflorus]|uniref:Exocyst complex component 5 n=1 Tax=Brachionus calyciflorus TaxID=104777 RepID=A0A813P4S1_9BILA|nr:unnamed protein product [Brachionus calyciflorus]
MAHLILKEIEQENFNVDNLIENLTYKATDGRVGQQDFDPLILEDIFKKTIEDLKKINDKTKQKIESLESDCQKEKNVCKEKILKLEQSYKDSFEHLSTLDKRISNVSSTMSDMGSQLENLNRPRLNLFESFKTAKYFDKFMDGIDNSGVFADDSKLESAAEVIYKLYLLSSDLNDERFDKANSLIANKYSDIEIKLIQRFHQAFFRNDKKEMKKYLNILSNFKDYQECIIEFTKNLQLSIKDSQDLFSELLPLCIKSNEIFNEVLPNNERIMEQFVKDLFLDRVQTYVNLNIEKYKETDLEKYLDTIYLFYNKTKKIFKELSDLMKMSSESTFFNKLLNEVFQAHLKDYINLEKTNLQNKFKAHLDRFYEKIGHTKKNLQSGFIPNFLSKNSNELIDERFLSHDVTTLCIDDAKKSINRTLLLCDSNSQAKSLDDMYEIICQYLCRDHIYYSIDLHINALQSIDFKQEINLYILPLIKQLNDLMYLFEQFTNDTILPSVINTPYYQKILSKLKQICSDLELKVDNGLEKAFVVICNHIKHVLQMEQKRTDFKTESDEFYNQSTVACSKAIKIVETQVGRINDSLDGINVNKALNELGIKFHRCVYDHLFRYEYNELGGMALIRDINDYRLCAKNFKSPVVDKLFTVLYSLSTLLVAKPANLQEICSEENLRVLSKDTIESFVQLRSDARTLRFQINRK